MARSVLRVEGTCPVCGRDAAIRVADFPLQKSDVAGAPLFHCLKCRSAHFRHEPADSSGVNWHVKVMPRNLGWSADLADALRAVRPFGSVIDVGCGIGTWLSHLASTGVRTLGFEPGVQAANYGRDKLGLDIHPGYFEAGLAQQRWGAFDLVTCIMVLEHLPQPRVLIREIAAYCNATGASTYVSVPFYHGFDQLAFDSESKSHSVFNNVDAHVTYFSEDGLKLAFREHGMVPVSGKVKTRSNNWSGFMFSPESMSNVGRA